MFPEVTLISSGSHSGPLSPRTALSLSLPSIPSSLIRIFSLDNLLVAPMDYFPDPLVPHQFRSPSQHLLLIISPSFFTPPSPASASTTSSPNFLFLQHDHQMQQPCFWVPSRIQEEVEIHLYGSDGRNDRQSFK